MKLLRSIVVLCVMFGMNRLGVAAVSGFALAAFFQFGSAIPAVWAEATLRFDFAALKRLIENDSTITSVESLIPRLPVSYRAHYILIYRSKSNQEATPLFPRVILYGAHPKSDIGEDESDLMVMAYQGSRGLRGNDSLETIEFNPEQKKLIFREIQFSSGTGPRYKVSEENPARCMACHGPGPHYNWRGYPDWPGVYGSGTDTFTSNELEFWQAFTKSNWGRGRYAALIPYTERLPGYSSAYNPGSIPSGEITKKIANLNFVRVAREILESRDYSSYRYAIYGVFAGCDSIDRFLPAAIRESFRMSPAVLLADTRRNSYPKIKFDDFQEETLAVAQARYLFENRGINAQSWMSRFDRTSYEMVGSGYRFLSGVGKALARQDRQAEQYARLGYVNPASTCEKLRELSLEALN